MKTTQLKQIKDFITEEEKQYNFNDYILNYVNLEDFKKLDLYEVVDYIRDLNDDFELTNDDIIYYYKAIEYLKENDPSLSESLEIAKDYGYTTENLNSELLASLLSSKNNLDDFNDFLNSLDDFINNTF